jgi:hypothetical protein
MKGKIFVFTIFLFFLINIFSQEPTPPVFDNITISCEVSYDCPPSSTCYYTYKYNETNPPTNTLKLSEVWIPLESLDDVILPQPIDFNNHIVARSNRQYIEYWNYRTQSGAFGDIPKGYCLEIHTVLQPGESSAPYPDEVPSYKPPTIKVLWVDPATEQIYHYVGQLCEYRGIDCMDFPDDEERQIFLSYLRKIPSLGPSPAWIGTFEHWDLFISDVEKAKDLNWVLDNSLYLAIDQKLKTGRQAASDGDYNLENAKLQEVIDLISSSNQSQRKDEFYYLVYYNAQSLMDTIPWPCEPKMTATPDYAKHPLGDTHEIEVTLINQSNKEPLSGEEVTLEVIDGPNIGTIRKSVTNEQGKAILSYVGANDEGLDEIELRTREGSFAEKGEKTEKKGSKKAVEPKTKKKEKVNSKEGKVKISKKERKRIESDCSADGLKIDHLYAEWEGYRDLAVMLSPKAYSKKYGDTVNFNGFVYNFGNVSTPATKLRFFISEENFANNPPPQNKSVIGEIDVPPLEGENGIYQYTFSYTLPTDYTKDIYYFDACVDPDDEIAEKTEWNNCASSIVSLSLTLPQATNRPPDCSKAKANVDKLWPPNHKLQDIAIEGVTDPENDPFTITVTSITQDEPTNGLGDGDTSPDGFGVGTSNPKVRAERSGKGNGRVYQINFKAVDSNGGECSGSVKVGVPHDKKDTPIDDGQNYDSTKP